MGLLVGPLVGPLVGLLVELLIGPLVGLLVELLTGRKHHYYDVSDSAGWRRLARDMSCICDMSVDECKSFIADLYGAGLINREQYDELHRVTITRILADAKTYAEAVAMKQLAAWKMNRKKMGR